MSDQRRAEDEATAEVCSNVWHRLPPSHAFDEDMCPECGEVTA